MLRVQLFSIDPDTGEFEAGEEHEVDFVSLVNNESFGKPPLIAPENGRPGVARENDTVFYVNTSLIPAFTIKRLD